MSNEKLSAKAEYPSTIQANNLFQHRYLQERLGVTREQLKRAIDTVGNDKKEVVAWLSKQKRRAELL